jgi:polyphosphate kinase 2
MNPMPPGFGHWNQHRSRKLLCSEAFRLAQILPLKTRASDGADALLSARRNKVGFQTGGPASEEPGSTMSKRNNNHKKSGPESEAKNSSLNGQPKIGKKEYEAEMFKLQVELVKLQDWVRATNARIVIIFEGRDAAGKGGVIKRIMERVSPRIFRVAALPAPTERQKTQLHAQRYIEELPAGGEVAIFDRSWYNRAGVEYVMGFCTKEEHRQFLRDCPAFEGFLVSQGIILLKYWLEVSKKEQHKRFLERIADPSKRWKLSPMDLESHRRWYDFSRARDVMLAATDTPASPWYIVPSDDKKRARLNCISHILSSIPYEEIPYTPPKLPPRQKRKGYVEARQRHRIVPQVW